MNEKNLQTLRQLVSYGAFMPDVARQYPLSRPAPPVPVVNSARWAAAREVVAAR